MYLILRNVSTFPGGDASNGNKLWIWDCNGSPGQGWGYDYEMSSIYSTIDNTKCLDLAGGDNNNGNGLQVWDCNPQDPATYQQRWIVPYPEAMMLGGKCLDLSGGDATNGNTVGLWDCNGQLNQAWVWTSSSVGNSIRYGPNMMKCLDLSGGDTTNGNRLQVWDCEYSWQQQWGFDSSMGTVYLSSSTDADATKCIAGDFDTAVFIWDCDGGGGQQWGKASFQFGLTSDNPTMNGTALNPNGTPDDGVILV